MAQKNKFGLKRHIPEAIKKKVRLRCGFGCVVCGGMFYDYEHFDPVFEACQSHSAEGITLLCGRHHSNKTRSFFPHSTVIKANDNPYAKHNGFWEDLTFDNIPPTILLGTNETSCYRDIFIINNKKILCIDPPEQVDSPYLLSACFFDNNNNKILDIEKNVIKGNTCNIDIKVKGGLISIKSLENSITFLELSLKNQPLQFEISKLYMVYEGNTIEIDKQGELRIRNSFGGGFTMNKSKFNAPSLSDTFCIKVHPCGRIEGFGHN